MVLCIIHEHFQTCSSSFKLKQQRHRYWDSWSWGWAHKCWNLQYPELQHKSISHSLQGIFSLLSSIISIRISITISISITCEDYNSVLMCTVMCAVHFKTLHLYKMQFWYMQRGESLPARIPEHSILTHARWCHIPTLGRIQKTSSQTTARCLQHRSLKYTKKFLSWWHKFVVLSHGVLFFSSYSPRCIIYSNN